VLAAHAQLVTHVADEVVEVCEPGRSGVPAVAQVQHGGDTGDQAVLPEEVGRAGPGRPGREGAGHAHLVDPARLDGTPQVGEGSATGTHSWHNGREHEECREQRETQAPVPHEPTWRPPRDYRYRHRHGANVA
jgi:hypothetical protein